MTWQTTSEGTAVHPSTITLSTQLLAHGDPPAAGAAREEVIVAALAGLVFLAAIGALAWAYRRGRLRALDSVAAFAGRVGGVPGWAALPIAIGGSSLLIAVFGFYWDVATHLDHGRDPGPFANPSHWWILVGLVGLAVGGITSVLLGTDDDRPGAVELRPGWRVSVGGLLLLLCGVVAMFGFPIDDVWHRIFGQDVTLWSPPHIQMVAGASLCTLALWVMLAEVEHGEGVRRGRRFRWRDASLAGAVLIGMSTLQGEFDYGVPQFALLYQPLLIAVAAGIALVPARIRLGRGGALMAVGFFLTVRVLISVIVSGVFEHVTFHFPLYLGAAVAVELAALLVPRGRQVSLGAAAGLGIATLGVAVEWLWSQFFMPVPWTTALFPEIAYVVLPAGIAAGAVGGFIGRAIAPLGLPRQQVSVGVAPAAAVILIGVLAFPLPTAPIDAEVAITLEDVEVPGDDDRHVRATFELDPAGVADGADWFMVLAWQGADWWSDETTVIDQLEQLSVGTYRTTRPIPVDGTWKSMLRLHAGRVMAAVPIFLPEDQAIPAEEVPAEDQMGREFVSDHELLLREARDAAPWLNTVAYAVMALIAAAWIGAFIWGFRRLRLAREDHERTRPEPQPVS